MEGNHGGHIVGDGVVRKAGGGGKGRFLFILCMFAVAVAAEQASRTPHPPWLLVRVRLLEVSLLR